MIAYYELTKNLYDHLIADEDLNSVVIGNPDKIDVSKQTLFPLAHILINSGQPKGATVDFAVTITSMDIIDIEKDDPTFDWKGEDNKQQILNTMFAVLESVEKSLDKGDLYDLGWELLGDATAVPFEDQYENLLTGWSMTFTVSIPNSVQGCATPPEYDVKMIAANNEYITSPDAQYLPDTIAEIDIEVDFEIISEGDISYFITQGFNTADDIFVFNRTAGGVVSVVIKTNGIQQIFTTGVLDITGNIKVIGNGSNLEIYLNDILKLDELVTISQDITSLSGLLVFNSLLINVNLGLEGNIKMSRVKVQDGIWLLDEGTGSTTTNSEGVVSTLNSDVSTEAMWVEE